MGSDSGLIVPTGYVAVSDCSHACKCLCHTQPLIHDRACCEPCACGQKIPLENYIEHLVECHKYPMPAGWQKGLSALVKYTVLSRYLAYVRELHNDVETPDEEDLVEAMEILWWEMTDEEQEKVRRMLPSKSLMKEDS